MTSILVGKRNLSSGDEKAAGYIIKKPLATFFDPGGNSYSAPRRYQAGTSPDVPAQIDNLIPWIDHQGKTWDIPPIFLPTIPLTLFIRNLVSPWRLKIFPGRHAPAGLLLKIH